MDQLSLSVVEIQTFVDLKYSGSGRIRGNQRVSVMVDQLLKYGGSDAVDQLSSVVEIRLSVVEIQTFVELKYSGSGGIRGYQRYQRVSVMVDQLLKYGGSDAVDQLLSVVETRWIRCSGATVD